MSDMRDGFDTDQANREIAPSASELTVAPKQLTPDNEYPRFDARGSDIGFLVRSQISEIGERIEGESVKEFLARRIQSCKEIASRFSHAKLQSDRRAREFLIEVAAIVLSPWFDIDAVCQLFGCKVSKSIRRSPGSLLIRQSYPGRDQKVISKQSIALRYALEQSGYNIDKLREYFERTSIKQCLRDRRAAKAGERENKASREELRLIVRGVPEGLSGEVVMRIEIQGATARFVGLF